jgi:transposase
MRYHNGERDVGSVVHVPAPEEEDVRQPHRDRDQLVRERTEHYDRINGLLANLGLGAEVDGRLLERVDAPRQWDGSPVPAEVQGPIALELERRRLVERITD